MVFTSLAERNCLEAKVQVRIFATKFNFTILEL